MYYSVAYFLPEAQENSDEKKNKKKKLCGIHFDLACMEIQWWQLGKCGDCCSPTLSRMPAGGVFQQHDMYLSSTTHWNAY